MTSVTAPRSHSNRTFEINLVSMKAVGAPSEILYDNILRLYFLIVITNLLVPLFYEARLLNHTCYHWRNIDYDTFAFLKINIDTLSNLKFYTKSKINDQCIWSLSNVFYLPFLEAFSEWSFWKWEASSMPSEPPSLSLQS